MIKVLVVDDSLFMRTLISDMLNSDPEVKVIDTAKDGEEAIQKLSQTKPDCITLDLAMPGWDGLTTLEHIISEYPTPVIILSAHSKKDADITVKCLNAGAVAFVLKPSGELSLNIGDVKHQLLEEVKAASNVDLARFKMLLKKKPKQSRRNLIALNKIVVVGASTGGPQTLESILYSLPVNFPAPLVVVQHVPSRFFTESLAEHLNRASDLEVKVAEDNEVLKAGRVYLAPSGCQMIFKPLRNMHHSISNMEAIISLTKAEPNNLSPSIDIAMESIAKIYDGNTVGIILSGMGNDGCRGMKAIKDVGGRTIAQDKSSLIFGMPKAVIDAGYADKVLSVNEIAEEMMRIVENRE